MDVYALLDRLDEILTDARKVPLTSHIRVDRDEILDIVDQIRATLPEEIAEARRIVARENAQND